MLGFWLLIRYSWAGRFRPTLSAVLSVLGMVLGVGSLVVAMAVVSGYQSTLKRTVIDMVGHMVVIKRASAGPISAEQMVQDLEPLVSGIEAITRFIYLEAVLAHSGQLSGVVVEGVDASTVNDVLSLRKRIIAGGMDFSPAGDVAGALIGKGLASKHNLKVGDEFRVVMPSAAEGQTARMRARALRLKVRGVLDLGRYDYDSRYVLIEVNTAQQFAQANDQASGLRLRLKEDEEALRASLRVANQYGSKYWVRDWHDANRNLFEAVRLEKMVLFFVLLVIVVAAAFNIASTLFVSVVRRYRDVSVLKTIGASERFIIGLFTLQGLLLGIVGTLLGLLLGGVACLAFLWLQKHVGIIPSDVYKLDHIEVEVRPWDLLLIVGASLLISLVATFAPARRGAAMPPVEGLRYE